MLKTDDLSDDGAKLMGLIFKHERELRAYARTILHSLDQIDEVIQEACVTVWMQRHKLEDISGFLPWAKVIVRNLSFRARRKAASDRHVFSEDLVERMLTEADQAPVSADHEYRALMGCLDQLSVHHRELLLAPYRGAGKVKQIASESGKSANSLYKLLQRLRCKLRDCVINKLQETT